MPKEIQRKDKTSVRRKKKENFFLIYVFKHKRWYDELDEYLEYLVVRKEEVDKNIFDKTQKVLEKEIKDAFLKDYYKKSYESQIDGEHRKNFLDLYRSECKILEFHKSKSSSSAELMKKRLIKKYHTVTFGNNKAEEIDGKLDIIPGFGPYIVYRHIAPNKKSYVGVTRQNKEDRWKSGHGYERQRKFWNAIKHYGWKNFKHEILKKDLDKDGAEYWEKYYIQEFNSIENGYNVESGGFHH